MNDSAFLREPELLSLVLTLKHQVDESIIPLKRRGDSIIHLKNAEDFAAESLFGRDGLTQIAFKTHDLVMAAYGLQKWLINQCTEKVDLPEVEVMEFTFPE